MSWPPCCCSGGGAPSGPAGGQLSGTYPDPSVVGLTTSDATPLGIGLIPDGKLIARVGASVVGVDVGAGVPSVAGLQSANFNALSNRSYRIDVSATYTVQLPAAPADGDLVVLVPDLPSGVGGTVTVDATPHTLMGAPSMAFPYLGAYGSSVLNSQTWRFNAPAGYWELLANGFGLSVQVTGGASNEVFVSEVPGGLSRIEILPGKLMTVSPAGGIGLIQRPYGMPWDGGIHTINYIAVADTTGRYNASTLTIIELPGAATFDGARVELIEAVGSALPVTIQADIGCTVQDDAGAFALTAIVSGAFGRRTWQYDLATTQWWRV